VALPLQGPLQGPLQV